LSLGFLHTQERRGLPILSVHFNNKILMYGPDMKLNFEDKFVLNVQYIFRTDSHVFDENEGVAYNDVTTQGDLQS